VADTHTYASAYAALKARLIAAGLKPGATDRATGNPASIAESCFTIVPLQGGDTGELRTRSNGHMSVRVNYRVEILHVRPPKSAPGDVEDTRMEELTRVIRTLHVEDRDLTREMRVQFGDATFDQPGAGAYLRTMIPVSVQFIMSMALP
jgi:hypothetical protein